MCDKKNNVLFTDTGCFVLSPDFKLADEVQVLLKVPRKNNMYNVDMKNIIPKESLTCLVAKATLDESMLWHRRLAHNASNDEPQPPSDAGKKDDESVCTESEINDQERPEKSTQDVNTTGPSINTETDMFSLGDNATLEATHANFFSDEIKVDMSNITTTYLTKRMIKTTNEQGFISAVYEGKTHEDLHTCLFAWFLSQEEPKRFAKALGDSAWVEVFRNKKDERCIVFRNKARLVAQGHTQKEGIDYDEVFAPVARIKVIKLFLAYASFMGFMVYQMDMKSAFLYDIIEEEVYVNDIIFGFTKKELCTEFEKLMHDKFQMSSMRELTFFLGLQKFSFTDVRTTSTPIDTEKPLLKDSDGDDVEVYLYRISKAVWLDLVISIVEFVRGKPAD
ncbi:putative ribonuclease H-like domain-containing protein [Tanacetum coccineum]